MTRAGEGWKVEFHRNATKDGRNLAAAGLAVQAERIVALLSEDPFRTPPPFEKLVGELSGLYSRRINRQHRLVYEVIAERRLVRVLRMWGHRMTACIRR